MRCESVSSLLLEAFKGSGSSDLSREVRTHLEHCSECRELWELWSALGDWPTPPPDPGLPWRFRQRLKGLTPPRRSGWILPIAAALLLVAVGAFAAGLSLGRPALTFDPGRSRDRLQAIALAWSEPREDFPEALVERIAHDPSSEVRLAAVEALYLFADSPHLVERLEEALMRQDRPEVRLALVDLLAALREKRAAEALRRLLQGGHLEPGTRHHVEQRLRELRL